MRTIFFEENENGQRWIDVEKNSDGEFDIVLKTQAFAPDGGVYSDISRDVLGYFSTQEAAEKYAAEMAAAYGFSIP